MKVSTIATQCLKALDNSRAILQNCILSTEGLKFHGLDFCLEFNPTWVFYEGQDIAIPFKQLAKFLDSKSHLSANLEGKVCILQSSGTKMKLPWYNVDEIPDFVHVAENGYNLESFDFHAMLGRLAKFANKEKNRFQLDSVKMDLDNKYAVSTDQVSLRAEKLAYVGQGSFVFNTKIIALLKALGDVVTVYHNKNMVTFEGNNFKLSCENMPTQFPNYVSALSAYNNEGNVYNIEKESLASINKDLALVACENAKNGSFNGLHFGLKSPIGEIETGDFNLSLDEPLGINLYYLSLVEKIAPKKGNIHFRAIGKNKPLIFSDDNGATFMSPCLPSF